MDNLCKTVKILDNLHIAISDPGSTLIKTVKFMFVVGDFLGIWALYNLYSQKSKDALLKGSMCISSLIKHHN